MKSSRRCEQQAFSAFLVAAEDPSTRVWEVSGLKQNGEMGEGWLGLRGVTWAWDFL
jgi:hypothetical protein